MDFEVAHALPAAPERVAQVLLDKDFQASLFDVGGLKTRSVISQEVHSGGMVIRHTRCVLDINVNGPARRFLGNSEPAWIEEATWHPRAMRWDWVIHPEVAAELLHARGAIDLEPHQDGTLRLVHGRVSVRVPLYGGKVEGWIVEGLKRAYGEEAERLAAWLERT